MQWLGFERKKFAEEDEIDLKRGKRIQNSCENIKIKK